MHQTGKSGITTAFVAILGVAGLQACSRTPAALAGKYTDATHAVEFEFKGPDSVDVTRVETGDRMHVSYKRVGDRIVVRNSGEDDIVLTLQPDGSLKGGADRVLRKVSQ